VGWLVDDDVVDAVVRERLQQHDWNYGFIVDGFPRNVSQAQFFLESYDIDAVIVLDLPDDEVVRRVLARRLCSQCGLDYYSRVVGYTSLLFDKYPAFGSEPGPGPVRNDISFELPADRLTNGLRFIWIIPAALIALVLGIAGCAVALVSWFAIVITGKQPRGMWDFLLKVTRYTLQTQAYGHLMTDTYPKFDSVPGP
jgi:adenylate kinase family enzyme